MRTCMWLQYACCTLTYVQVGREERQPPKQYNYEHVHFCTLLTKHLRTQEYTALRTCMSMYAHTCMLYNIIVTVLWRGGV